MDEYLEYQEMIDEALNEVEELSENIIRPLKKSGKTKSNKRGKS